MSAMTPDEFAATLAADPETGVVTGRACEWCQTQGHARNEVAVRENDLPICDNCWWPDV